MRNTIVNPIKRTDARHPSYPITTREQEVLHLIAYEYSSKQIAHKLYVNHDTVNTHRKNLLRKMGVKNAAGLVRAAFERQILPISPLSLNA